MDSKPRPDQPDRKAYAERLSARLNESGRFLDSVRAIADQWEDDTRESLQRSLSVLAERERVIRYQLNQLESAGEAAVDDLWNGLEIAWERFAREVGQLKESVAQWRLLHSIPVNMKGEAQ
jgi:hypothetical protein